MRTDHPESPAFYWQAYVAQEHIGDSCPVEQLLQKAESLGLPTHYEIDLTAMRKSCQLTELLEKHEEEGYVLWVFACPIFRSKVKQYYQCVITDPEGQPVYRSNGPEVNDDGTPYVTGACLSEAKEALEEFAFLNQKPFWEQ